MRTAAGTAWLYLAREQTGRVLGDGNQARAPWGALAWTGGPGRLSGGQRCLLSVSFRWLHKCKQVPKLIRRVT